MKNARFKRHAQTSYSIWYSVIVLLSLLFVAGCASLSKVDCLYGDWYDIGYGDGNSGVEADRFSDYVNTCAKFDVRPDLAEYTAGRAEGLKLFCTRGTGYSEGRRGKDYRYVCSGTAETQFLDGHSLGYSVHATEKQVLSIERAINQRNSQIQRWEKQRESIEEELIDEDTDTETRKKLVKDLNRRSRDITEATTQIKQLQERKIDAIIDYREAVDEANDNGFREARRY